MTHEEKKQEYLAYREAAKRLYHRPPITISEHANVQITEDGAFVEAIVFISKQSLVSNA